jgi:hypothetical protein
MQNVEPFQSQSESSPIRDNTSASTLVNCKPDDERERHYCAVCMYVAWYVRRNWLGKNELNLLDLYFGSPPDPDLLTSW